MVSPGSGEGGGVYGFYLAVCLQVLTVCVCVCFGYYDVRASRCVHAHTCMGGGAKFISALLLGAVNLY